MKGGEAFKRSVAEISEFIRSSIYKIREEQLEDIIQTLIRVYRENKKVLVIGAGRSGLIGKAFAMRLMHLGYKAYVLGDTIVPRIGKGDLVFAISGSGRTKLVVTAAEAAKAVGAEIVCITSFPDSPLGKLADHILEVPGRTKVAKEEDYFARQILGIHEPLAPLGTLFEDTAMVVLDGIIVELMSRLNIDEKTLRERHANIE